MHIGLHELHWLAVLRHMIFDRQLVYDQSNFVTDQTRPVMTGPISGRVRAQYLTGHLHEQP